MSNCTLGPWEVDKSSQPDDMYTWVFGPDGKPIAGTSGRIKIADAHLIAAAPDLLDALKSLLALVEGERPSLLEDDDHYYGMVADAIGKAEGR